MARGVRYGTVNADMIGRWLQLPAEDDGAFWAVNLMKYKARADYGDGSDHGLTGKEADDAYSPIEQLAAVGAMVALHGDVVEQAGGDPQWDRIGIVRYPSRRAFFEMQQRDDFKRQHEHKSAGMDVTIVMATAPSPDHVHEVSQVQPSSLVMRVLPTGATLPAPRDGVPRVAVLDVEGVIVGDDRTWSSVVLDAAPPDALAELAAEVPDGSLTIALAAERDRLVDSIVHA